MRWMFALAAALASHAAPQAVPTPKAAAAVPRTILFVGNSFTFGALSPVHRYRADMVTDLNGDGVGGVPALFKTFTEQAGLAWRVSLETQPGRDLAWHWENRRAVLDRRWDVVVLQGYSTLDPARPGDPARHVRHAALIAAALTRANPAVDVELEATWTRADLTYLPGGHWRGAPVERMAEDLQRASLAALAATPAIDGVIPVGLAWNRAFARGVADPNPFDGTALGQVDLWARDHYHASAAGYYLSALTVFGRVTGVDPRTLGRDERAARDLGLEPALAVALQAVAADTLAREGSGR